MALARMCSLRRAGGVRVPKRPGLFRSGMRMLIEPSGAPDMAGSGRHAQHADAGDPRSHVAGDAGSIRRGDEPDASAAAYRAPLMPAPDTVTRSAALGSEGK